MILGVVVYMCQLLNLNGLGYLVILTFDFKLVVV